MRVVIARNHYSLLRVNTLGVKKRILNFKFQNLNMRGFQTSISCSKTENNKKRIR